MYARVSRVTLHPGSIADAMAVLRDHGLAVLKQAHGFAGGLWLHDPQTERGLQFILWERETDFERMASAGVGTETRRMLEPLMAEMSPPQTFEAPHWERVAGAAMPSHAAVVAPPPIPGTEDEAMVAWRKVVLPALARQEGYAGSGVFVDRAAAQVMDVSLWVSETTLRAAMDGAAIQDAGRRMARFLAGEPTAHQYRVEHVE